MKIYTSEKLRFNTYTNGVDVLKLSLDNDYDTIARTSTGKLLGFVEEEGGGYYTKVTASLWRGDDHIESGKIGVTGPSSLWEEGTHYTVISDTILDNDGNDIGDGETQLKIIDVPDGATEGNFVFSFEGRAATFSLKIVPSEVDYDLVFSNTVINIDEDSPSTSVYILERGVSSSSNNIYGPPEDGKIRIMCGEEEQKVWNPIEIANQTTFTLQVNIGTNEEPNWIKFDEETITIVHNGKSSIALDLDNDADVIARTSTGKLLGFIEEGENSGYYTKVTASVLNPVGGEKINVVAPNEFMTTNNDGQKILNSNYCNFTNNTLTIKDIPPSFEKGHFTFDIQNTSITKKFTLAVVASEVDYDLKIDRRTINLNSPNASDKVINVQALKRTATGSETLSESDDYIVLQTRKIGGTWSPQASWAEISITESIEVRLYSAIDGVQWDSEIIEIKYLTGSLELSDSHDILVRCENEILSVSDETYYGHPILSQAYLTLYINGKASIIPDNSIVITNSDSAWNQEEISTYWVYDWQKKRLVIIKVPIDSKGNIFTITCTYEGVEYTNTFKVEIDEGSVDYNLLCTPTVVNTNGTDVAFRVKKKAYKQATQELTSHEALEKENLKIVYGASNKELDRDDLIQNFNSATEFKLVNRFDITDVKDTQQITAVSNGKNGETVGVTLIASTMFYQAGADTVTPEIIRVAAEKSGTITIEGWYYSQDNGVNWNEFTDNELPIISDSIEINLTALEAWDCFALPIKCAYTQTIANADSSTSDYPRNATITLYRSSDGVSFTGIEKRYKATDSVDDRFTKPTDETWKDWSVTTTAAGFNEQNKYLWSVEKITTNAAAPNNVTYTEPEQASVWGIDGRYYEESKYFYAVNNSSGDWPELDLKIGEDGEPSVGEITKNWKESATPGPGQALWQIEYQKYNKPLPDETRVWIPLPVRLLTYVGVDGIDETGVSLTTNSLIYKEGSTDRITIERNEYGNWPSTGVTWNWYDVDNSTELTEKSDETSDEVLIYVTDGGDNVCIDSGAWESRESITIKIEGSYTDSKNNPISYHDYVTIKKIKDGESYTFIMSNPHAAFSADENGNVKQKTQASTIIYCYKGTTPVEVNLGNPTNNPDEQNIVLLKNDPDEENSTPEIDNPTVTLQVTGMNGSKFGADESCSGIISIPITEPIVTTLEWSWTKTNTGSTGPAGTSYQFNPSSLPTAEFKSIAGEVPAGQQAQIELQYLKNGKSIAFELAADIIPPNTTITCASNNEKTKYTVTLKVNDDGSNFGSTGDCKGQIKLTTAKSQEDDIYWSWTKTEIDGTPIDAYQIFTNYNEALTTSTPTLKEDGYPAISSDPRVNTIIFPSEKPTDIEYLVHWTGKAQKIDKTSKPTITWGRPELIDATYYDHTENKWKVYGDEAAKKEYLTLLSLTKGGTQDLLGWNNNNLFIKATWLEVPGKFKASKADETVSIGGFEVTTDSLTFEDNDTGTSIHLGVNGIKLGQTFSVDNAGYLIATSGLIGGFTLRDGNLYTNDKTAINNEANGVFIGDSGISLGAKFKVTNEGILTAKKGYIGGWTIGQDELVSYAGDITYQTIDGVSVPFHSNSVCMKTLRKDEKAVNALAIGKCSYKTWGQANFRVTYDGKLYAKNADIAGTITAEKGRIGGFDLQKTYFGYQGDVLNEDDSVIRTEYFYLTSHKHSSNYIMRVLVKPAGGSTTMPFALSRQGILTATGANITGTITAEKGKIGLWEITEKGMEYRDNKKNLLATLGIKQMINSQYGIESAFYFDNLVTDTAQIDTLQLGWGKSVQLVEDFWRTKNTTTQTSTIRYTVSPGYWQDDGEYYCYLHATSDYPNNSGTNITKDITIQYGGHSRTFSITLGKGSSTAEVKCVFTSFKDDNEKNAFRNASLASNFKTNPSSFGYNNKVDKEKIECFVAAQNTGSGDGIARLGVKSGSYSTGLTYQSLNFFNIDNNYATSVGGIYNTSSALAMFGTWANTANIINTTNAIATSSDQNRKNCIAFISEKYNIMFDNFIPRIYKYNEGTSNRFHTGFIAQEVAQAIQTAGLSTQDFAGYIDATQDFNCLALRYEEFIALNTWQIQKLKPRMSAAEQEILELKTKVSTLESELENLKNSQNSVII